MVAAIFIGITTAVAVLEVWSFWRGYGVLADYLADLPGVASEDVDDADRLNTALAVGYLIALIVAGIAFIVWLWRARQNAEAICQAPHRRSRGWIIGAWICPIVNLWFPYQVVDDVYRASRPGKSPDLADLRTVPGSALLPWWWALWLAMFVANRIAASISRGGTTLDSVRAAVIIDTIATAVTTGAAVLIIMIMRRISGWQAARWAMA